MEIVIIPGFTGYPEEKIFEELEKELISKNHSVTKIAWPNLPEDLDQYSFTNTISHARNIINKINKDELIILGFSMGGIIATELANEFPPQKLGLIVSPYQAGTGDDLAEKYEEWKEIGSMDLVSSKFGELRIPFSFIEDAQKYNALDHINNIECPKLFIVGEKDSKVPYTVTEKLYDKATNPKVWHKIPNMEHKYKSQPEMIDTVDKIILDFIEEK